MNDDRDYNERHTIYLQPSAAWIQKQADAFVAEMERQKRLALSSPANNATEELPRQLSPEEIANLSESEYAIYSAAMRERKRRKQLQKREDPTDKPGKSGGYQPTIL